MDQLIITPPLKGEIYSDYAYRILRNNIMQLKLKPGSSIDEHAFAQLLNISRTPIHESIQRLKDEHLVEIIPRKKILITKINLAYVSEGSFWRCAVEPVIVKSLVGNISPDYAKKLWNNLRLQEQLINNHGNRADFFAADDAFHRLLYLAANKSLIYNTKRYVTGHLDRVRYLVRIVGETDLESSSYLHHMKIYQQILFSGEVDSNFEQDYARYITAFQSSLPSIMKKNPDYFEFSSKGSSLFHDTDMTDFYTAPPSELT